jgi:DNA-binding NarL/FixJ family response regulator
MQKLFRTFANNPKTTKKMIQVIVVDDHPLFRIGLKASFKDSYPDIRVTGEADCGEVLFRLLPTTTADIVLLDINLPDVNGVEIARRLRRDYPAVKILAISAENTAETVKSMLEAGIDGFISKRQGDVDELVEAIRTVTSGWEYFGRDISAIIYDVFVSKKKTTAVTHDFTEREKEIILACRDGLLCKEIAARLGISTHTVNTHKNNIFKKLGINNTMEMVQYALKKGIIKIEN